MHALPKVSPGPCLGLSRPGADGAVVTIARSGLLPFGVSLAPGVESVKRRPNRRGPHALPHPVDRMPPGRQSPGMRPSSRPGDPYAALGLAPGATRAEIRSAYRRLAMEVHPDVAGRDTTAEMAALNTARDDLLSRTPGRRAPGPDATTGAEEGSAADQRRHRRSTPEPTFSHAPTWDDYWAAWNDPPRRTRS